MQTIDKIIDGKSVSFWLDGEHVRAAIGERVIGDIASATRVPGFVEPHWTRARDWHLFASAVLDPVPSMTSDDEIASVRAKLFDVVLSAADQLRKEAA
jgi:hypothetical protein